MRVKPRRVAGGFCADLNRFNLLDYKEHLDYRLSRNLRLVSRQEFDRARPMGTDRVILSDFLPEELATALRAVL